MSDAAPQTTAPPPAPVRTVISREEINRLPIRRYEGEVVLVSGPEDLGAALAELRAEDVLGFDTETRAAFRKGESYLPSLVQLAGGRRVYLFQLARLPDPEGLFALLADPAVLKVGVGLAYDLRKLQELRPFTPAGFQELEPLADRAGIGNNGLRGLSAILLGFRISKGAQRSNWSRPSLSRAQIEYAATDAWVSREIYLALLRRGAAGAAE